MKREADATWKWVLLCILVMVAVVSIQDRVSGPPPNDEPYTGLCTRASAQLSC